MANRSLPQKRSLKLDQVRGEGGNPVALLQVAVIVVAALWVYGPALHGGWLWDDGLLITDNTNLRSGEGLWRIWFAMPKTDYWPLTWTLLWIEWHLWGNEPLGYHVVTLALHVAGALLVWRLLGRLGLRWGWVGGLLFAIHPLAVESVAWVSEVKNTLSLPLYLMALEAWMDREEGRPWGYLKSILYYGAAMLAKTSTVMLPAVLLLYCWWKKGRIAWPDFKRTLPFFAIALVLGLATIFFQSPAHGEGAIEIGGPITRLMGAGTAIFFYLWKFVLPIDLLPIYPQVAFDPPSVLQMLAVPVLAGLVIGLWTQRRGWGRHVLLGFGFFLLNLFPVVGLLKMQYISLSWVADHLAYIAIIGLIGLFVAGIEKASEYLPRFRPSLIGMTAAIAVFLAWESHGYAKMFSKSQTLWTYTLERNPNAPPVHFNLGWALQEQDETPEAIDQYVQALKLNPDYVEAHNNLGNALLKEGRTGEAAEQFRAALQIDPGLAAAHNNLGTCLFLEGHVVEAQQQYEKALKIDPDYADAHNNLGNVLLQSGRIADAMNEVELALKLDPHLAKAHNTLGNALAQSGRTADAMEQYQQEIQVNPQYPVAYYNLGNMLKQSGHYPEAAEQYRHALQMDPNYGEAHNNLGIALAQLGQIDEAIGQLEAALRCNPNSANARSNLLMLQSLRKSTPH